MVYKWNSENTSKTSKAVQSAYNEGVKDGKDSERKATEERIADWVYSLDANDFFKEGILSYQGMFEEAAHKIRSGAYRKEGA